MSRKRLSKVKSIKIHLNRVWFIQLKFSVSFVDFYAFNRSKFPFHFLHILPRLLASFKNFASPRQKHERATFLLALNSSLALKTKFFSNWQINNWKRESINVLTRNFRSVFSVLNLSPIDFSGRSVWHPFQLMMIADNSWRLWRTFKIFFAL